MLNVVVVSNMKKPECPVIYVSPQFLAFTGYSEEEVLGKNCRLFQYDCVKKVYVRTVPVERYIDEAVASRKPVTVENLLNFTKAGKPFHNSFTLYPLFDGDGELEFMMSEYVKMELCEDRTSSTLHGELSGYHGSPAR